MWYTALTHQSNSFGRTLVILKQLRLMACRSITAPRAAELKDLCVCEDPKMTSQKQLSSNSQLSVTQQKMEK